MIDTKILPEARAFAARLARQVAPIARARGEAILREHAADPQRWRLARLLWPNFTKG